MRSLHRLPVLPAALLVAICLSLSGTVGAQTNTVYTVQIQGEIDLGLVPYLNRVLDEAAQSDAEAVILEINTPGGRLDAVLQMRDSILNSPVRTIAFVNREAFSAGALIAIASESIYMAPGAVVGAATPVEGGTGETASEKVISAVRKTFKSTAETRGRDPAIAEAMVDPSVEIEGLVEEGQLLTLTTAEALERGYADGVVSDRDELLEAAGLADAALEETSPSLAEQLVRFLTSSVVASVLLSFGLLLILADAYTEGFGIAGGVGLLMIAVFFWGHFLAGLAGWEGVALVVLGLALIAVEVLVIPGFGVAGILGILSLGGGIFLSLIGEGIVTPGDLLRAGATVGAAFLILAAGVAVLVWYLPRSSRLSGLVLRSQVGLPDPAPEHTSRRWPWRRVPGPPAQAPHVDTVQQSLVGSTGVALSDLRPGGIAQVGDERVDVVTRGDYIRSGEPIEVIADEGYRRVVRRIGQHSETA